MFVVCFGNGLGNQMFQYAFFKSLEVKKANVIIKMDIDNIFGKDHNGFELDVVFGIEKKECSHKKAIALADYLPKTLKRYRMLNYLYKVRKVLIGGKPSCIYEDDPTCYYNEVYELNSLYSYIFIGNWVNEKYFSDIRLDIVSSFSFINKLVDKNLEIAYKMENENSVSIHIRRGDYAGSGLYLLTIDYYVKSIEYIKSKIDNPKFYLFSNDMPWVRENFNFLENKKVIDWNTGVNSYIDMQLMSLCKHNIIANSTFSFWGAYLNKNSNKIVISPSKAGEGFKNPFSCNDWIKI